MQQRYARLYPLFLVGTAIGIGSGFLALVFGRGDLTGSAFGLAAISGLLMLPSPTWHTVTDLVPLNHPAWSLIYELGVNVIFACAWRWLSSRILVRIVAISGAILAYLFYSGHGFAGPAWPDALLGVPRVCFGFFIGILIGRHYHPRRIVTPWAWAIPLLLLPILYAFPVSGATPSAAVPNLLDASLNAVCVLVLFPALIIIGANFEPAKVTWMATLGLISYPLYVVHEPALFFVWRVLSGLHLPPENFAPLSGILFGIGILVVAWLLALADQKLQKMIRPYLKQRIS